MIPEFEDLEQEEKNLMYSAPVIVAILIAGADGKIDRAEMREAVSITSMKKIKARQELKLFYDEVTKDFEDKFKIGISKYPSDPTERQKIIIEELKGINGILPKLNKKFAIKFYESLKDFAKKIAESSGGILGLMSVGYEESNSGIIMIYIFYNQQMNNHVKI